MYFRAEFCLEVLAEITTEVFLKVLYIYCSGPGKEWNRRIEHKGNYHKYLRLLTIRWKNTWEVWTSSDKTSEFLSLQVPLSHCILKYLTTLCLLVSSFLLRGLMEFFRWFCVKITIMIAQFHLTTLFEKCKDSFNRLLIISV